MARTRWWLAAWMLLFAAVAQAAGPAEVRKQIEASMLVTGSIDIARDGTVSGHAFDKAEKLPKGVASFVGRAIETWQFDPVLVDGKAAAVRTKMSVRIVARKLDENNYSLRIAGADFGSYGEEDAPTRRGKLRPPRYPEDAANSGVGGTVYLVLRFGRDGTVQDVVAEQVNMKVLASSSELDRWRDVLARAAIQAARSWAFDPPKAGPEVEQQFWSVRVPVDFVQLGRSQTSYGEWDAYVPGPRNPAPWQRAEERSRAADAIAADAIHYDNPNGPRLKTPLDQG